MTIGKWLLGIEYRAAGIAIKYKLDGTWRSISWEDYLQKIISISEQIQSLGLGEKNHIGISGCQSHVFCF